MLLSDNAIRRTLHGYNMCSQSNRTRNFCRDFILSGSGRAIPNVGPWPVCDLCKENASAVTGHDFQT